MAPRLARKFLPGRPSSKLPNKASLCIPCVCANGAGWRGQRFLQKILPFWQGSVPRAVCFPWGGILWLVAWFAWRKRSRKYYKSALSSILKSHPHTQVHSEDPTWANMAADLEQLRQEAENLRKKIRVSGERELAGGAWNEGGGIENDKHTCPEGNKTRCVRWGEWREGKSSRGPHAVLLSQRLKYTQGVMKVQCVYKLCTVSYITQRVRVQPAIHQCIILVLHQCIIVAGNCYL